MTTSRDVVGQRSETVRRANLSSIVRELHLRGPLSRSELVARTGLTRSAIRGLIGELVAADLVEERRSEPAGTPGRPSPEVRARGDQTLALALEANVDSLAMALVGLGGTVHRLERVDRPRAHVTVDEIADDLVGLVRPMLEDLRSGDALVGIGVAVAGVVRRSDGIVRHAPNLGWRDAPLGDRLAESLELDVPVWLANEADLGGLAEHRRGAAAGADEVVYVMGEVGVGGNLIAAGRPLVGAAGYGGEVGHMPVNPEGLPCGCGAVGCWETEIGERALLVRAGRDPDGGRAAVSELIGAAGEGEARACAALEHVAAWLGVGLATLINILNPQLVVLGGVFERIHPLVGDAIEAATRRRSLRPSADLVRIVPGQLGVDAPIIGAAELAFEPVLADPAARLRSRVPALASA